MNQDLPDFLINRIILSAFQNLSLKWDVLFHCSKKSRKSCNPENQGSKTIPKAAQPQPKTNHNVRKVIFSPITPIIAEKDQTNYFKRPQRAQRSYKERKECFTLKIVSIALTPFPLTPRQKIRNDRTCKGEGFPSLLYPECFFYVTKE
ncbi:hypothetical protein [Caldithrix abyssi]|uniref:hypothetical protein n=1 Tax=Caldithrix abyssi TaxID=187145 RepID=UPI000A675158|nr:hypothetical protein [Caldithrix abyssi]